MKHEYTIEELQEMLADCQYSPSDGKNRCVDDSSKIQPDGEIWAVISDHGNAKLYYKGRSGRLYNVGGLA